LAGTLAELEVVVAQVEQASSLEAACESLRLDIELPGALRWARRRVQAVHASLNILKGLLPAQLENCQPTLVAFKQRLHVDLVLPRLREIAALYLQWLPTPLGLHHREEVSNPPPKRTQHQVGPDPP
jgi:hypothetical protein